jgi:hypothetical protein
MVEEFVPLTEKPAHRVGYLLILPTPVSQRDNRAYSKGFRNHGSNANLLASMSLERLGACMTANNATTKRFSKSVPSKSGGNA